MDVSITISQHSVHFSVPSAVPAGLIPQLLCKLEWHIKHLVSTPARHEADDRSESSEDMPPRTGLVYQPLRSSSPAPRRREREEMMECLLDEPDEGVSDVHASGMCDEFTALARQRSRASAASWTCMAASAAPPTAPHCSIGTQTRAPDPQPDSPRADDVDFSQKPWAVQLSGDGYASSDDDGFDSDRDDEFIYGEGVEMDQMGHSLCSSASVTSDEYVIVEDR
ncbi:hypothetical protein SeMB42_g01920 [Synchytrium endobioticum]|uniref:Uncharacterized protein n=1 Tax=Synchytrium endobioticum TaxID=286115 RepID=A0A507DAI7_9FUNG|nr:hypothetical protein SeLEV6574_g01926 [Synchytrium endobioticum]TPX51441.1 hypothetical protein SeMB42_g01920 [Synchytrium endobioticum]